MSEDKVRTRNVPRRIGIMSWLVPMLMVAPMIYLIFFVPPDRVIPIEDQTKIKYFMACLVHIAASLGLVLGFLSCAISGRPEQGKRSLNAILGLTISVGGIILFWFFVSDLSALLDSVFRAAA